MIFLFLLLILNIPFSIWGQTPEEEVSCDKALQEPAVLQELRRLNTEIYNSTQDRASVLLLKKQFDFKVLEIAKQMRISKEQLLAKLTQDTIIHNSSTVQSVSKKSDLDVLNEIVAEFKKNYAGYDKIESLAREFIPQAQRDRDPSFTMNIGMFADVEFYRPFLLGYILICIDQKKLISWPFTAEKTNFIFKGVLSLNDLTAARTILKLVGKNKEIFFESEESEKNLLITYIQSGVTYDLEIIKFLIDEVKVDPLEETEGGDNIIHEHFFVHLDNKGSFARPDFIKFYDFMYSRYPDLFIDERFYFDPKEPDAVPSPLHFMNEGERKWAISKNINLDVPDADGKSLLFSAVEMKKPEMVELLLSGGADMNYLTTTNPETPLEHIEAMVDFLKSRYQPIPDEVSKILSIFKKHKGEQ